MAANEVVLAPPVEVGAKAEAPAMAERMVAVTSFIIEIVLL